MKHELQLGAKLFAGTRSGSGAEAPMLV